MSEIESARQLVYARWTYGKIAETLGIDVMQVVEYLQNGISEKSLCGNSIIVHFGAFVVMFGIVLFQRWNAFWMLRIRFHANGCVSEKSSRATAIINTRAGAGASGVASYKACNLADLSHDSTRRASISS